MFSTYLEIINDCDNFPFIDLSQTPNNEPPSPHIYYELILPGDDRPHGYIHPAVVQKMPWTPDFHVSEPDQRPRRVTLVLDAPKKNNNDNDSTDDTAAACSEAFRELVYAARDGNVFQALSSKKLDEHFRMLGTSYPSSSSSSSPPWVHLPRSATGLFGIANRGAHMTVYTRDNNNNNNDDNSFGNGSGNIKIWVPRRSAHLRTWPGRLDNSVAGGVRAEESPLECIIHEADEEASLDPEMVRKNVVACGAVSYVSESGAGSGGEHGLVIPDVLYVYDLAVPSTTILKPQDDEVEAFHLWDIPQVKRALFAGEFKTNCNLVLIDFFVRHGIITEDSQPDYLEILTRLRRRLPVPTSPPRPQR